MINLQVALTAGLLVLLVGINSYASDLVINFDDPDPVSKYGLEKVVKLFSKENPDIHVKINMNDRKTSNFLSLGASDITAWYPSNREVSFLKAGQFEDISDLWMTDLNLSSSFKSVKASMSYGGLQWGVPYSYYQWGIFYRADIFAKYHINIPETWPQLFKACDALKRHGIIPFTIGTKFLWPAAMFFDYINLRTNGYQIHTDLMVGKIKYTDKRIRKTFLNWREMLKHCAFVENHATMSWQDALLPMVKGKSAMYLIGEFAVSAMKQAGLKEEQIGYFKFPEITKGIARVEETSTDAFFIPFGAKNKTSARKFLKFISRPEIQGMWNKIIGQLPPNSKSPINKKDKFIVDGFEVLSTASALTRFYDREMPAVMAKAGMESFQRFMIKSTCLESILKRLAKTQKRVYANKY